jgi:pimeloyl-ACP methyl ester carboxylesterase
LNIERIALDDINGHVIPAVQIGSKSPKGGVVLVHGYGGCKEELIGVAWRIAEFGFTTCSIDLGGHGESPKFMDGNILADVEIAANYCRRFGKVAALGHSLGGKLALASSADYGIGISPPLPPEVGKSVRVLLKRSRSHRVRQESYKYFPDFFSDLPQIMPSRPSLIIYGSKDFQEIIDSCKEVRERGVRVEEIKQASHHDIFLYQETLSILSDQLNAWFSKD